MNIITTLGDYINTQKNKIQQHALMSKFKQRKYGLKSFTFLLAFTVGLHSLNEITLDLLASKCEEFQEDLSLTKQALFQKLETGTTFLKNIYLEIFSTTINNNFKFKHIEVLEQFSDVKFTDGTTISLPDKLKPIYKGLGGKNSNSAMKIQATYSLFERNFTKLDISSATQNDSKYNSVILDEIKENELCINDLGYFDKHFFSKITVKGAYYISRIKKNTILYKLVGDEYVQVSLENLLNTDLQSLDEEFYLKLSETKMEKVRLTGIKLPDEKINEKKRKANKIAEQKGICLTQKEKILLEWFLVITNIYKQKLSFKTICELYRLRWQIELCFKALKTGLGFDNFSNCGKNYFECLLYGKLICVALTMKIFSGIRVKYYFKHRRLISIQRFVKNMRGRINEIINVLLNPTNENIKSLIKTVLSVADRSLFEKRKRKTTEYRLMEHSKSSKSADLIACSNL